MRDRLLATLGAARSALLRASRAGAARAPAAGDAARRGLVALRRRPDLLLVAGLLAGVLAMIIHWS